MERTLTLTLLGYPEDSIGRMMTTDYIAVKMNWTIEQTLEHIRAYGHDSETINVIYIVDDNDVLIDDIRIKELLFAPKDYKISQITDHKFLAVSVYDPAEDVINIFNRSGRTVLPVVDEDGSMLGIVTVDDILRLAEEKSSEDLQKIGGMEALDEPYMDAPFLELMKKRAGWLIVLLIGEMFTTSAMTYFEVEIAQAVVLALFLPLIISSGGNAGSQSSTLIIRAMALNEISFNDWPRVMRRELMSGVFLGIVLGIIAFVRVAVWGTLFGTYGSHTELIGLTVFFAIGGVVLWGSLMGSMLPMLLRRLQIDPATASAPLVATLVDVVGIVIYFSIAMVILKGTLL
jgi:magnesium transporter